MGRQTTTTTVRRYDNQGRMIEQTVTERTCDTADHTAVPLIQQPDTRTAPYTLTRIA